MRLDQTIEPERMFRLIVPIVIIVPIGLGLVVWRSLRDEADRKRLVAALQRPATEYRVSVAGRPISDPHTIIEALRTIHDSQPHHSSPTNYLRVEISGPTHPVLIWVARDSVAANEYWVFQQEPGSGAMEDLPDREIGRVNTEAFSSFEALPK